MRAVSVVHISFPKCTVAQLPAGEARPVRAAVSRSFWRGRAASPAGARGSFAQAEQGAATGPCQLRATRHGHSGESSAGWPKKPSSIILLLEGNLGCLICSQTEPQGRSTCGGVRGRAADVLLSESYGSGGLRAGLGSWFLPFPISPSFSFSSNVGLGAL